MGRSKKAPEEPKVPKEYIFRLTMSDGKEQEVPFSVEGKATPYEFCIRYLHLVGMNNVVIATLHDHQRSVIQMYEPERGWYFGDGRDNPIP